MEPAWEQFSTDELKNLARMYARNWQTLDGLWFRNVEAEFGLGAAVRIDLKNWEKQSVTEAQRIRETLGMTEGGLRNVLQVLSFMSWQVASPGFEVESETAERIVFGYPRCPVQEGRKKLGKPVFPCKTMKTLLLSSVARVVEPKATLKCLFCPPDEQGDGVWCKWELTTQN